MKISQREARRMKKRIAELEDTFARQRRSWASEWPRGVLVGSLTSSTDTIPRVIQTARKLGHAVVCATGRDNNTVDFYALPLAGASR